MKTTKYLWNLHRWLGLCLGALFAVTAATGVVLIWSDALNLAGHRALPDAPPRAPLAPYNAALADWVETHPGSRIQAIVLPAASDVPRAWHVFLRPTPEAQESIIGELDPAAPAIVGEKLPTATWKRWLVRLHYEYLGGTAGAVLGWIVSTGLVLLAVTGFWIYRNVWRELWRRPRRQRPRGTLAWLHRWLGAWALVLALIWGVTGFIYMQSIVPGRFAARANPPPTDPQALRRLTTLPALHARAQALAGDGELTSLNFVSPRNPGAPADVRFRFHHRERWFWEKISTITLAGDTGDVRSHRRPGEGTPRERMFAIVSALHFGSEGGLPQQLLWTAGGLVMLFLPLSGYALWLWRRRTTTRTPPNRPRAQPAAPDATLETVSSNTLTRDEQKTFP